MASFAELPGPVRGLFDRIDVATRLPPVSDALSSWRSARNGRVYPSAADLVVGAGLPAAFVLDRPSADLSDWHVARMGDGARACLEAGGTLSGLGARRLAVRLRHLARLAMESGEPVVGQFRDVSHGGEESFEVVAAPFASDHEHPEGVFGAIASAPVERPTRPLRDSHPTAGPSSAADVMARPLVTVGPDTLVPEVAQIMMERRLSALPVVVADQLIGIVTATDLMRRLAPAAGDRMSWWTLLFHSDADLAAHFVKVRGARARDVMSAPVVTAPPATSLQELVSLMDRHRIRRVVIADANQPLGIVTQGDLLAAVAAEASRQRIRGDEALRSAILQVLHDQPWFHQPDRDIVVIDGVACVWGSVASEAEEQALRVAAEGVPGVKRVDLFTVVSAYPSA